MTVPNVFNDLMMAQQPVLKRTKEIFGYELLFRGESTEAANITNGETATSQVLVNLCIGITELESQLQKPFFINMTTELILSEAFFPISPSSVYIEILEKQNITPDFIEAVKKWHSAGYRFVLDDYQFREDYEALLPWVTIIKVDIFSTPLESYKKQIQDLKRKGILLLAEKVESLSDFEECKNMGFDLFQGYFLQHPKIIKGKKIDSATQGAMELVNQLQDQDIHLEAVVDLAERNPKLSYQLLRILNSPICGVSRKVTTIKEAVVLLGLVQLKKWALLIALTSSSTQPLSLLKVLLTRGRCCQLQAQNKRSNKADAALMVGLMSGIDAVFGVDRVTALDQIALDNAARGAILNKTGELGGYLSNTLYCEEQNWEALQAMDAQERATLNRAFLDAMLWAEEVVNSIY